MRLSNPECYLRIEPSKAQDRPFVLNSFHTETAHAIVNWLGERCVVVRNDTDENKLDDAGVPDLKAYVLDRVIKTVSTEPRFLSYWTDDMRRNMGHLRGGMEDSDNSDRLSYIGYLFDNDEIRSTFGLTNFLTSEDRLILYVWRCMQRDMHRYRHDAYPGFDEACKIIEKLPTNPHVTKMVEELQRNRFLGLLLRRELEEMLIQEPTRVLKLVEAAIT